MAMARKEKPGAVLAIALGAPKGKPKRSMKPMMGSAEEDLYEEEDPLADPLEDPMAEPMADDGLEDFYDYAATAFPEMEGDPARMKALWQAVKACVKAGR